MEDIFAALKVAANQWAGASVRYRDDWDCQYFSVAGKGFCMFGKNKEGELVMTVKGLPENNEILREQYTFIVPGYYSNKTHWNSILLEKSSLTQSDLTAQLQESYKLVVATLPKKIQKSL